MKECHRIRQEATDFVSNAEFEDAAVVQLYDEILAEVSRPAFLSDDTYLADMNGKELMAALVEFARQHWLPKLRRSALEDELTNALERVYKPHYFNQDDFLELANRLV